MPTLKEMAELERIRFVENEIDLSTTFLKLAATEAALGDLGAVESLRKKARVGLETGHRFWSGIESPEERERLQTKLEQLRRLMAETDSTLGETHLQ